MTENADQKQAGRFKPGTSGNPKGKPPGTRNAALVALDAIGEENAKDILQAAVTAAKAGDMRAADVIFSRVWPARKGRTVAFELPQIETARDILNGLTGLIQAVASEKLTPDEAVTVAGLLELKRKAIETLDMERRIAALEAVPKDSR